MNKPLVSIGLPVFNDAKYLKETIDSILNQTYKNIEVIIVDDGSTDNSLELIASFKDSRTKVLNDGRNFGLAVRLNQIAKMAEGHFLARMDADDIMHPTRIEKQVEILQENTSIDVLGSNVYTIDETGELTGVRYAYSQNDKEIKDCVGFIHPTIMATRKWFLQNPYDEHAKRAQDAVLWRKTYQNSTFKYTTEPLLYYREMSSGYYKKYFKALPTFWKQFKKSKDLFWVKTLIKYTILGFTYKIFNLFGKERTLIKRRNQIQLN